MSEDVRERIEKLIKEHKVILFMRGTKMMPQCGFSAAVVECLNAADVPYESVDVSEDETLRQGVKAYTNWPMIPQLFIDGKFVGGGEAVREMHRSGELKKVLDSVLAK